MRLFILLILLVFGKYASASSDSLEIATLEQYTLLIEQAQALKANGDLNGALAKYQLLITQLLPDFKDQDPLVNPDEASLIYPTPILIDVLESKAAIFEEQADSNNKSTKELEKALSTRELIVDALFHLRQTYFGPQLFYDAQQKERMQEWRAIDLAYALYEKTNNPSFLLRCFRLVERSKKALLSDALVNPKTNQFANVPASRVEQIATQKNKVSRLKMEWAKALEATNQEQTTAVIDAEKVYTLERKAYNKLLDDYRKQYARVYALRYNESIVTVGEIQNRLSTPEEVMLSYFTTDEYLYAFVITLNGFRAKRIERPAQLNQWITQFHFMLKNKQEQKGPGDCKVFDELALKLYQTLIQPFEPFPKEVVIVPDALIGYVPFNTLLYQSPETSCDFANYPFLLDKYQISTHYSAEQFAKDAFSKKKKRKGNFVAIAPDKQGYANKVARQMGGKCLLFEDVNTSTLTEAMAPSAILLLSNPVSSYCGKDRYKSPLLWTEKGMWFSEKANTSLVVMSECDQENIIAPQGDHVPGLARGFLYMGAESVLTSLWPLSTSVNEVQLPTFFKMLNKGKGKDEALQKSSQLYRKKMAADAQAAPSYWAGYMLIGNADPITKRNWYWLLLGIIPIAWLWLRWRKRKKAKAKKDNEVTTTMEY